MNNDNNIQKCSGPAVLNLFALLDISDIYNFLVKNPHASEGIIVKLKDRSEMIHK